MRGFPPLTCNESHADRAHYPVIRRHRDLFAKQAGKGGRDRIIISSAALEVDDVADFAPAHHAVEVIERDGISQAGHQVRNGLRLVEPAGDVALHKDRAALAQARWKWRCERERREFAFDGDP